MTQFITKLPNKYRTAILTVPGDRRDDDIREMGRISGENFDRIVIRKGSYLRGREASEIAKLLQEGIDQAGTSPQVRVIDGNHEAIAHAVKYARKGELIVTLADRVSDDIAFVHSIRDKVLEEQAEASENG